MAVKTTYWVSTTGDFIAAGSWSNGYLDDVGDDTLVFDGRSQVSAITNVDRESTATDVVKKLIATPNYTGNVGSPGSPLIFEVASSSGLGGRVTWRGSGTLYWQERTGGYTEIYVDSVNLVNAVYIGSRGVDRLLVRSGGTIGDSGGVATLLVLDGMNASYVGKATTVRMTNGYFDAIAGTVLGVVHQTGGMILCRQAFAAGTKIYQHGGYFKYTVEAGTHSASSELHILGGTFDVSGTDQGLAFSEITIGKNATIVGNLAAAVTTGASFKTDMREEYP